MRKTALFVPLLLLLCACSRQAYLRRVTAEDALVLARGPVVQDVRPTSAVFLGRPADDLLSAEVTVEAAAPNGVKAAAAGAYDPRKDTFEIKVEGLAPDTRFSYVVRIGDRAAGPFSFRTAPEGSDAPIRFAAYGDTRTRPEVHAAVADAILRSDPSFVLCCGDLVADGTVEAQWDAQYFGPARNLFAHVPVYPCLGNHEKRGERYFDLHALPGSDESYYAMVYGPVRVITLDQYQEIGKGSPQYAWAEEVLAEPFDGWTIAQWHEPPFGAHPTRGINVRWVETLVPLMERYKVDLVINGHDHYYLRCVPLSQDGAGHPVQYVISGGGGAPLYAVDGTGKQVAAYRAAPHFLVAEASTKTMKCRVLTPEGELIDAFTLSRAHPAKPQSWASMFSAQMVASLIEGQFKRTTLTPQATGLALSLRNPADKPVTARLEWNTEGTDWTVAPAVQHLTIEGGATASVNFTVGPPSPDRFFPAPAISAKVESAEGVTAAASVRLVALNQPEAEAKRVDRAPALDGVLDDACWQAAAPIPIEWRMDAKGKAKNATSARIAAAPDALYVAFDCREDDMQGVRQQETERDGANNWMDDCVEVFLDGDLDRATAVQFIVTIGGAMADKAVAFRGLATSWDAFDGEWSQAVKKGPAGWTVEVRIPWRDLGLAGRPEAGAKMGMNLSRLERNPNPKAGADALFDYAQWAVTHAGNGAVSRFGTLTIE